MPRGKVKVTATDVNPDYVRMYYEHQYDRINRHEEQSLNVSNIVLTISAVIITFGFSNKQSLGAIPVLFLPVVIIIGNVFAMLYNDDRGKWIAQHQKRAKRILERYMPELYALDKETIAVPKKWTVGRKRIQNLIHFLFILIAILLLVLFSLEVFGASIM